MTNFHVNQSGLKKLVREPQPNVTTTVDLEAK